MSPAKPSAHLTGPKPDQQQDPTLACLQALVLVPAMLHELAEAVWGLREEVANMADDLSVVALVARRLAEDRGLVGPDDFEGEGAKPASQDSGKEGADGSSDQT